MNILHVVVSVLLLSTAYADENPVVRTPLGKVRGGYMTSRGGRKFMAFSGLPYAKPPVGELRFEAPVPLEPWTEIKNATVEGPWCVQYNMYEIKPVAFGVEDCLYLSLYTHSLSGQAPVLVHFHGGGFTSGNGAKKTGPQYLMDEDVVIVDVNYRLRMFGFLSFEDRDMPGNQALKDQVMALRWVQQNIASFGGDPNKVTLVGESAGAGSVYHHTVSPLSKGLFHRAIAESGTSYCPWAVAVPGTPRNASMYLLSLMGCKYTTTKEAVNCLKTKDALEIVSKAEQYRVWQIDVTYTFGPVLEPPHPGAFLPGPIESWKHDPKPFLMGTTSGEGLLRANYLLYYNTSFDWIYENFNEIVPVTLKYSYSASDPDKISKAIRDFYFSNGGITSEDWLNVTRMYTDSWFTTGILDGANKHTGPVYFYYFDYLGKKSIAGSSETRNETLVVGAPHTEEIIYLWYNKNFENLEGEDLKLSKNLVKIWTDFAKYGNPTPKDSDIQWDKWTQDRHRYVHISHKGFEMKEGLAEDRHRFWNSLNYRDNYDKFNL